MTLAGSIKSLTNDGHTIAQFLVNTMEGQTEGVKVHHRLDAAKQLCRYGFSEDDSQFWGLVPTPEELAASRHSRVQNPPLFQGEGCAEGKYPTYPVHPVSYLDILNYDIARQIRDETGDGHLIVEFLVKVMNNQQAAFTPDRQRIRPADRMAAAKELMRRGFGDFSHSRRSLSEKKDDYHTMHSDFSQRIREFTEYGGDVARFLLDVMSGELRDEGFTISQRVFAARELLRRAYDINYDGISWVQIEDYWKAQDPADCAPDAEPAPEFRHSGASENPAGRAEDEGDKNTPSPSNEEEPAPDEGRGRDGSETPTSSMPVPDHELDYYYEPLTPAEQALFDYRVRLESCEHSGASHPEALEELIEPTPAAYSQYADELLRIREAAAAEGVPVLPNPLAGALKMPAIRSP